MDPFRFEHAFRFTEKQYVELNGPFRKKTKPLRVAAVGAVGVACLFSPYTLVLGIVILAFLIVMLTFPRRVPGVMAHAFKNSRLLHDTLTYGVDHRGLRVTGPLIEARVPWAAAYQWDERDGWLRITAYGVPNFWFPVAALKEAGVHEQVMELVRRHAVPFNSPEARARRR